MIGRHGRVGYSPAKSAQCFWDGCSRLHRVQRVPLHRHGILRRSGLRHCVRDHDRFVVRRHLGVIHLRHHVFLLVMMRMMVGHDGHTDMRHRDTGSGGYGHNVGVDKGIRHAVTGSDGCTRHVVAGF